MNIEKNVYTTLKEAAAEIERLIGLSFSLVHVRHILLALGLSRKKQKRSWQTGRCQATRTKKLY
jgi:transposase